VLRAFLINWGILAAAFAVTAAVLSGVEVDGGFGSYLIISAIFGLINAIIGTILRILTLPIVVLTLGLFSLVINAVLLWITDHILDRLSIDDFFWTTILAALVLAIVSMILHLTVGRAFVKK
jgi:putative membrane protein